MRVASPGTELEKPKYDHRAVRPSQRLSADQRDARYAEERRQGEQIAAEDLEAVWGWTGPAGSLRAERRAAFLVSAAGLKPGVRALELGAGTGQFTERLLASRCELVALELSEATAEICRDRVDGRAEVVVGNVETGDGLEGREFDAIVGVSILHHVNMELCLRNTFTKLRSGGRFAFSEPNMANPQVWAMKNVDWVARKLHETKHETAFRTRELRRLFEDAGFRVDVCEPFDFLHPKTPGRLVPAVRRIERVLERTPLRAVAGSIRIAGRQP
jgi:SAM-dependent methyltransferase